MKKILVFCAAIIIFSCAAVSCKKITAIPLTQDDINITIPTITNTPTITPTPRTFVIAPLLDDMEDGDNANNWGGYWYTYSDVGPNPTPGTSYVVPWTDNYSNKAGAPISPFYMQSPGCDGAGNDSVTGFAARITGTVTWSYTYGFVGLGSTFLDPKAPVNLNAMASGTGVSFWAKGDGRTYKMKIGSAHGMYAQGESDNFFEWSFVAPAAWTQVTVPYSTMTQEPYWGTVLPVTSVADTLVLAVNIQWQTQGADVLGNSANISLSVDDVTFY